MTPTHPAAPGFVEEVEIHGHIIDSLLLPKILDEILTRGGAFTIKDVQVGQRRKTPATPTSKSAPRPPRRSTKSSTPSTTTAPSPSNPKTA